MLSCEEVVVGAKAELGWGDAAQRGLGATAELQPKPVGFWGAVLWGGHHGVDLCCALGCSHTLRVKAWRGWRNQPTPRRVFPPPWINKRRFHIGFWLSHGRR